MNQQSTDTAHEAMLIDALRESAAYPQRPDRVEFLQTHISLLFFAGSRVYKIKKPVDMGFLDYTTIERRRHFCEEEVRLNRRLAPDVYLGVVRIVRDPSGAVRICGNGSGDGADDGGETIDYAVEMVRLPDDRMLPKLIERDAVGEQQVRAIAQRLARFHAECPTGPEVNQHATVDALRSQSHDNIEQLREYAEAAELSDELIEHIALWCESFLDEHGAVIKQRIERGRVREGHGDLHAGNICLLKDEIVIYDCIEFTPKFRCRDVAAEISFLMMDMDFRGHADLGRALVKQYTVAADDAEMYSLLDFFKVHFAIVRAKVAAIKSTEEEVQADEREDAANEAQQYLHLAAGYTLAPALVLMCGLPATGKSTVAHALARPLTAEVLRTDAIRKELAGLEPTARGDASMYRDEVTDRTYTRVSDLTRAAAQSGRTVLADATFASARRRERMISLADAVDLPWVLVHTTARDEAVRQRMNDRAADEREVSDADWAVYTRMREHFQPPDEVEPEHLVRVDETADVRAVISQVLLKLAQQTARGGTGARNGEAKRR